MDIVEHVAAIDEKLANMRVGARRPHPRGPRPRRPHRRGVSPASAWCGSTRIRTWEAGRARQWRFLNSLGNGVVITTVVSRDFARMYVKLLKDGAPGHPSGPRGESKRSSRPRGAGTVHHPSPAWRHPATARRPTPSRCPRPPRSVSAGLSGRRPPSDREVDAREPPPQTSAGCPRGRDRHPFGHRLGGARRPRRPTPMTAWRREYVRQRKAGHAAIRGRRGHGQRRGSACL